MTTDQILIQLAKAKCMARSLLEPRDGQEAAGQMVSACEAATDILTALQDEGVDADDNDSVRDLVFDYRKQAAQLKRLHAKFEVADAPVRRDGVWHCPACNHRIAPRHGFCHWCGKKIGGW